MIQNVSINGIFDYKFLDSNNELKNYYIGVINGNIYKDILTSTPTKLTSPYDTWQFQDSKCSFAVYNDKLFIANGKDYIFVYDGNSEIVSQMGAPMAKVAGIGNITGTFAYAITFITAGGEEITGTISNNVFCNGNKVELTLPLGYDGTTSRKIYRAYNGDYSKLDLLATIADNTTLKYVDNILYNPLAPILNPIPEINNELPKPYFIKSVKGRLIGCKCDNLPTQLFITDAGLEIFDSAKFIDISNFGDDNTPIEGMGIDFSSLIVGTKKNMYLLSIEDTVKVYPTRVNTGIKDGYSVVQIPTQGNFPGGLMFVSSNNDIRILSGLDALPVPTSINNVQSLNWAQNIRGSLDNVLRGYLNMYAIYFNNKYILVIDGDKYVFDIRTSGWTFESIETENYQSKPYILAILGNDLYNGQVKLDTSISDKNIVVIEREYSEFDYMGQEVPAFIESAEINVSEKYKFLEKLLFWFKLTEKNEFKIKVICDDETEFSPTYDFSLIGGAYSNDNFIQTDYDIYKELDYRIYNIQKPARWVKFRIENNVGNGAIQGWDLFYDDIRNKE